MKNFLDDELVMDEFQSFLAKHKTFILNNMEEIDPEVANQKTRWHKIKCWLKYGHLYKKGICLRCQSVQKQKP